MKWLRAIGFGVPVLGLMLSGCGGSDGPSLPSNQALTAQGIFEGVAQSDGGVKYLGIPYAMPPVGGLRWKDPVPAQSHAGTVRAEKFSSMCAQAGSPAGTVAGSEDCLYLNVFVPKAAAVNRDAKIPVVVEIHGGGNTVGSAADKMAMASRQNAVVVTMNYRLGVAGYFAHPALTAENDGRSGNYGILDQQLSLKWVQANIAQFGGDPSNVTITGSSAGGSNVYFQLASPLAAGLFHKAFPMSGGYHAAQVTLQTQEQRGVSAATGWGCAGVSGASVSECLRALPVSKFALSIPPSPGGAPNVIYAPIIDKKVLTEGYISAFANGRFNRVPVISGFTRDEGTLWITTLDLMGTPPPRVGFDQFLGSYLGLDGAQVGARYPLADYASPQLAAAAAWTDWHMACSAFSNADSIGKYVSNNYVYVFADRQAPRLFATYPPIDPLLPSGAYHGSDSQFWWTFLAGSVTPATPSELALANTMESYLGNFIRTGDPNGGGLPAWGVYEAASRKMVTLQPNIDTSENGYATHKCDFWSTQVPSGTL